MNNDQLQKISHELKTQDNRITANPLFCVFEKERIYGMDPDYSDDFEWYDNENECRKVYYVERDRFVNAHFTEKAAQEHIRINGHNLQNPFIYVTSLWRCQEMIDLRNALLNRSLTIKEPD